MKLWQIGSCERVPRSKHSNICGPAIGRKVRWRVKPEPVSLSWFRIPKRLLPGQAAQGKPTVRRFHLIPKKTAVRAHE